VSGPVTLLVRAGSVLLSGGEVEARVSRCTFQGDRTLVELIGPAGATLEVVVDSVDAPAVDAVVHPLIPAAAVVPVAR
jgi:hypothetical protein